MHIDSFALERALNEVQKPARYVGGEWNAITKDWDAIDVSIALAYPDVYEIGMSNLGLAILYDVVNRQRAMAAERVYAPWGDMESVMRAAGIPLYSLESRRPLTDFDVIGFTLQTELTYTNVLNMLDLACIPLWAERRSADEPLIIAGGSCCYNPEPMAAFVDLFALGEGEEVIVEILEAVAAWKRDGKQGGRVGLLRRAASIAGVYVPSLYAVSYYPTGVIASIEPASGAPARVRKRIMGTLPPTPRAPVVPNITIVHDRAAVEIQRGCSRGCRFCQAGMIYRPIRERPVQEILDDVDAIVANTGHDEIGLVSLSSSDHSGIQGIVSGLLDRHAGDRLAISLPSLRIDSFSIELAQLIQQQRKTGFTFAPEAGSQRLRDVINKGVTEQDLLQTAEAAFRSGWDRIKLYFMLGLPTETDEDAHEIARLIRQVRDLGRSIRGRRVEVSASVATFVPKPHTPFQWLPLVDRDVVEARQHRLVRAVGSGHVQLSYSDWDTTWLEGLLSRGDRRLGEVIYRAWERGARYDAWSECFDAARWRAALEDVDLDGAFYLTRPRERDEILPWGIIDAGISDTFLWREWERALSGALSPDCREGCHDCGILVAFVRERDQVDPTAWGCP
ncbi:MAG: TIGR03960 family B12-binding radical SAM protein [Anaerolineae bacterium]